MDYADNRGLDLDRLEPGDRVGHITIEAIRPPRRRGGIVGVTLSCVCGYEINVGLSYLETKCICIGCDRGFESGRDQAASLKDVERWMEEEKMLRESE